MSHWITHKELLERLSYDPDTGIFTWLKSNSNVAPSGSIAGCLNKVTGYWQIRLNRETIRAHRLAWFYVYGMWPEKQLDHINRVKTDNRIKNLRIVTQSENNQNKKVKGYTYSKADKKWKAYIGVEGVRTHLGYFDSPEEAQQAYLEAKKTIHIGGIYNVVS
jgi:hypothetical protein